MKKPQFVYIIVAPSEPFSFKFIAAIKSPSSFSYGWKVIANWRVYSGTDQPGFYYDISLTISGKTEKVIIINEEKLVICVVADCFINRNFSTPILVTTVGVILLVISRRCHSRILSVG